MCRNFANAFTPLEASTMNAAPIEPTPLSIEFDKPAQHNKKSSNLSDGEEEDNVFRNKKTNKFPSNKTSFISNNSSVSNKNKRYSKTNHSTKPPQFNGAQKQQVLNLNCDSPRPQTTQYTNSVQCLREMHVPLVQYTNPINGIKVVSLRCVFTKLD